MKGSVNSSNVRTLLNIIETSLSDATEFRLFDNQEQVKDSFNIYLKSFINQGKIHDSEVECKQATWEDFYPSMPERLLAIEAVEKFGAVFYDTLPKECEGYPYRKIIWWSIQGTDEEGYHFLEYYSNSEDGYPPSEDDLKDGESIVETITYEIKDPTNIMLVDIYIKPIKPIEYITFNFTIEK